MEMAFPTIERENYMLKIRTKRGLKEPYTLLLTPGMTIHMRVINLLERRMNLASVKSLRETGLSLYHHFITGCMDFYWIPYKQLSCSIATHSSYPKPSLLLQPGGMIIRRKVDLRVLRANWRNCVYELVIDGATVTRVISTVYSYQGREMTNCWRVDDYSADGHLLMAAHCQFTKTTTKRKATSGSSSQPPPKKRLRI